MEGKAYIEKLVMEGFKSYGTKKREIPIGEGFIAVVGPNGAGKSNIGDAISFALGLSSAKALRAKNLSYLIFSKNGQKAQYAYVEVHFKNLGAFPISDENVVISRKVTKEGRSVFKINGVNVREKDLKDFLAKAGIYENAYNVVYQGDIVKFLKMTPLERRRIIEEVAGIGEYERKKEKALNDLAEVELKIKEIDLILEEIKTQLERLKEEKENLHRYKELKRKKMEAEAKLLVKEKNKLLSEKKQIENELYNFNEKLKKILDILEQNENILKYKEKSLREINEKIIPYKEKIGKLIADFENLERSIKDKEKELLSSEKRMKNIETLIENLKKDSHGLEREIENLKEEYGKEKKFYEELKYLEEQKLKDLEREEEKLKITFDEVKKLEEEKEFLNKKLSELLNKKRDLEIELRELRIKIEKTYNDIENLKKEKEEKLKAIDERKKEVLRLQEIKKKEEAEFKKLNEELRIYEKRLKEVRQKLEEVLKEKGAIEKEVGNVPKIVEVFKEIRGVYGTVSDLIKVKNYEHITAIEVAGGGRLRYIVVENENVAKECIDLAKKLNLGRFSFIPLNRIGVESKPLRYPRIKGAIDFAVNLIEYKPIFESVVRFIFGDTLIVEDFDSAKAIGIGTYRMVTLDGELFEKSGIITGGSIKASGELNKRYYEELLNELIEKEKKLKEEESIIQRKIKDIRSLSSEKFALLKLTEKKIEELLRENSEDYANKYENRVKKSEEYLEILKNKYNEIEINLKALEDEIEYYEEKLNNIKLKEKDVKKHYSQTGLEEKRKEYSKIRKKAVEKQIRIQELENEINKRKYELEYIIKEIQEKEKEKEYLKRRIEELREDIEKLKVLKEKTSQEIKEMEGSVYSLFKERGKFEKEISELKAYLGRLKLQEEELKEKIYDREKEIISLEDKLSAIEEKLSEYKDLEIGEVKESVIKLREEINKAKREIELIGNVNFRAQEDYEQELSRFNEYKEKQIKLKEESKAIKNLIEEIEAKKRKVFLEAFNTINKNLKRIFSFLSPGGRAEMFLDNEEDPFSGGVQLTVKPRGKDVQYLEAMSGGEKTLAALSLIFAIQEYKPSPFYYFDEVDAHLDEVNARKVGELIRQKSKEAQFIVVTLREVVASFADRIIGVSARGGISEVFALENKALEELIKKD